jgi:hypothetical protein
MSLVFPVRTRSVAAVSTLGDTRNCFSRRLAPGLQPAKTQVSPDGGPKSQHRAVWAFLFLNCGLPMLLGLAVYTLWRSTSLLLFRAYRWTGLYPLILAVRAHVAAVKQSIPNPILYSLPDAMWVYACTVALGYLWRNHPSALTRWSWTALPVLIAVGSEFGQLLKLVPGTFDWMDVSCYHAAFAAAMTSLHFFNARNRATIQHP